MAAKRARLQSRIELENFKGKDTLGVDMISTLPDHIIYHILSFVSTLDVIRMSLLSRHWRNMWCSIPVLNFCDSSDIGMNFDRLKFYKFVIHCLDQRRIDMLKNTNMAMTRFKLDLKCYYPLSTGTIDFLLGSACCFSKLKELDLCIRSKGNRKLYYLHPGIFSNSPLTSVKLCGIMLDGQNSAPICVPSLIYLSLESVGLDDRILHNILTRCCSLEKLVFKECTKLLNPRVSNMSLKYLEIVQGSCEVTFQVEAMNLQSLVYDGGPNYCDLNLSSCGALRHLSLSNMRLKDQWLEGLTFEVPLLESLSLCDCRFSHIKILSEHLKHFVFRGNKFCHALEAIIHTPNLVFFSFDGDLSFIFSMIAPNILQSNIKLQNPATHDTQWYFSLLDFLINLDFSKSVCLHVYSEEL
ncbi:F-box/LRR-repeat protein At3g58900-like isoform X2 [Humulus lupulus]|uniref:F-box/LRR-repeat protein At3g58900-like isoform X2 n=1 Tax=Humulus lupulus TaxID=3486 RepID=UPI002B409FE5|nr:F-box/LRR-repeat protein At3g58900-like isoform X2 [Humulus lupulus]